MVGRCLSSHILTTKKYLLHQVFFVINNHAFLISDISMILDVRGSVLLLNKRYNSCIVLAFTTIFFHSWQSWNCSVHFRSFIFLRSFLTSTSHLCLGLPTGRVIYGRHLYIFFTVLISGFLYMCPYQLSRGSVRHIEIINKMQRCIKLYYSMFI
jgi:hypothetical protein